MIGASFTASGLVPKTNMTRRAGVGVTWLIAAVAAGVVGYTFTVFLRSRRRPPALLPAPDALFFVVMIPCLNEELVIGRSLDRLLTIPRADFAVLVVDDGSDDRTADIVRSYDPDRVWLLQRALPEARSGKGRALNAGYRYLLDRGEVSGHSHEDVVVVILDADGRLEQNAFLEVAPYFRDPRTGAVQVGVRMYNARESLLGRMQDFEFLTFTEIFQRGRQRLGSVGLGGNGQFTRLSALASLGAEPWTDCLTEDLDLGLRLWAKGWDNHYCPRTHVSQQALHSPRRLVRQRTRWFQGHLQCWKRIPQVMRADRPAQARIELVQHLISPALVLAMSLPTIVFLVGMLAVLVASPLGTLRLALAGHGLLLVVWYLLALGLAPAYAFAYWLRTKDCSFRRSLLLAHLFCLYSYLWLPAGWAAVFRIMRRQGSWAKTARTVERAPETA